MSDTIQVELTKDDARAYVQRTVDSDVFERVNAAIKAALPQEYPDGTRAALVWEDGTRREVVMTGGFWNDIHTPYDVDPIWNDGYKVEPLRVLADDEIAVKRDKDLDPDTIREVLIENLRDCRQGHLVTREVLEAVAKGYAEAEKK